MCWPGGLLDTDARVEAIRNIQVSPAVELSANAGLAAGLVARLEDALARNEALYQLPGKFGMAVQAGNELDTAVVSDVIFLVQGDRIAMVLEGALDKAILFGSTNAAAEGFVNVANGVPPPSSDATPRSGACATPLRSLGVEAVAKEAGLEAVAHGLRVAEAPAPVGDLGGAYGIGFAYGEVTREALRELAALMRREGIAEASVSPQRALVFPVHRQEKAALADLAKRFGAITDPSDIRLRLHRCPGTPACRRATVESKHDAETVLHALARHRLQGQDPHFGLRKTVRLPA